MKQLKKVTVLLLITVMISALAGCGKKNNITGSWTGQTDSIQSLQLNADGSGVMDLGDGITVNISYQTSDDKLTIVATYLGTTETTEYTYSLKKNTLTLTSDQETIELKK